MYHIPLKTRIRIRVRNFLAKWGNKILFGWDFALLVYLGYLLIGVCSSGAYLFFPLLAFFYVLVFYVTMKQARKIG